MENSKIKRIQSANQKISSAISSLETLKLKNIDAAKKIDDIINSLSKNYCDLMTLQRHLAWEEGTANRQRLEQQPHLAKGVL